MVLQNTKKCVIWGAIRVWGLGDEKNVLTQANMQCKNKHRGYEVRGGGRGVNDGIVKIGKKKKQGWVRCVRMKKEKRRNKSTLRHQIMLLMYTIL